MSASSIEYAADMPLFDRLREEYLDSSDGQTKSYLSFKELEQSIIRDITNLLNTRIAIPWSNRISKITNPYLYGINIPVVISPDDVAAVQDLEMSINHAIHDFEPRLLDARAHVEGVGQFPGSLNVTIDAVVKYKNRRAPLSFPVVILI